MVLFCGALLSTNKACAGKKYTVHTVGLVNSYVNTSDVCSDDLLNFAQTLIGTRYRSASSNPVHGFDCSGFVSYVFKNFNFDVPRSSCEFIDAGQKVALQ